MKVWEKSLISFLIMPHRIPLRNALHPSPSLTHAVVASHDCHSISSHSLCTPLLGCLWPAWSSFAFWCPGHCSTGNVIAVFPQHMSMSLSSQTVALYWSAYTVPHLRLFLVWPENAQYLFHTFPAKSIQSLHVCSSSIFSAPYSKMATTSVLKMHSLVLELHFYDFHRGVVWKKHSLEGPVFGLISASVPPFLSHTVPR